MIVPGRTRRTLRALLRGAALPALVLCLIVGTGRLSAGVHGQVPIPTPQPTGPLGRVTYPPGWNLVAAANGAALPPSSRGFYTLQSGGSYQVVDATTGTTPGNGYWAYYDALTPFAFPGGGPEALTRTIPAGQYVLIGNPRSTIVNVTGADAVYIYDPVGGYSAATILQPGQGAWAFSYAGGTLTLTNAAP